MNREKKEYMRSVRMTKKSNIEDQLRQREERRKQSVVGSIIETPTPEIPAHPVETFQENRRPSLEIKKTEKRTRRKQILLQPSIHDRAEEKCRQLDISMNEVVNQLLQKWIDD